MKFPAICVAALLATSASAESHEYRVLFGGDDVGGLEVETDGDTSTIVFDYKQNGRGPTIAETLKLDESGMPSSWTITGRTTFGNPVNETYACADGKADWRDATGPGSADACSFYIDQNGSPWGMSLLAKALLAEPDGEMAVLPGGTARIRARDSATYDGAGGTVTVTTYEITGLSTNPTHVTLDEELQLFSVASPRFAIVREGYKGADEALRAEA